jgi:DNA-binding MarR family transcriptional regulator
VPRKRTVPSAGETENQAQVVDALLMASRALVAIAARSLADRDAEVTLPQFRALVVLASRGPQRVVDISAELGIDPSTGTRLCDRLVRKSLVRRQRSATDRRVVRVALNAAGRDLVDQVTGHRRDELLRIVSAMPGRWQPGVAEALHAFAEAAGEIPEDQWWMGWDVTNLEDRSDPEEVPAAGKAPVPRSGGSRASSGEGARPRAAAARTARGSAPERTG